MISRDSSAIDQTGERRRWMSLFARANAADLEKAWRDVADRPDYILLRRPETGLVMVRGRAGGSGAPFNMGEMTVTRCSVQLPGGAVGHGYVAGRNHRHAELAAVFDALMQSDAHRPAIETGLAARVEGRLDARRRDVAAKTAATRVDFFTLVRGEDDA